jgi:hypothetical protein
MKRDIRGWIDVVVDNQPGLTQFVTEGEYVPPPPEYDPDDAEPLRKRGSSASKRQDASSLRARPSASC